MACRHENGPHIDWACAHCPKKQLSDLSPYTHKLLGIYSLQQAGYPFQADDLAYEEWIDLGRIIKAVENQGHNGPKGNGSA